MKKILLTIILLSTVVLSPAFALAADYNSTVTQINNTEHPALNYSGFVKCDGVVKDKGLEPGRQTPCNFAALVDTVNKAINWMFVISVPVATVLFAYAGYLYMTGTSGNRTQANKIFTSVGIGFIIMVSAWFLVRTAVGWFVESNSGATTFLGT